MSPATHFLAGWLLANAAPLNRRDRIVVTLASVVPDVDGLGLPIELATRSTAHPLLWFSKFHHSLHSLLFGVVISAVAWLLATRRWMAALLAFAAFHLRLWMDMLGSRGPEGFGWPIPYLAPFSSRGQWSWSGQWKLNAWPNFVITAALMIAVIFVILRKGRSPVEIFSERADVIVVGAVRAILLTKA